VLVEDITDRPDSVGKKRVQKQQRQAHLLWDRKRKTPDSMEITLPYLPDAVITMDDMLGKVPKLRYVDHDVHDVAKFPELAEENY
jgi:hypothetical protein